MASDVRMSDEQRVSCPHCKKSFLAAIIAGGVERHRGFKCPHCRLFVPESRAEDAPLSRDPAS